MNPRLQSILQEVVQYLQDGNQEGARVRLSAALQNDFDLADARINVIQELGLAYANASRFDDALVIFQALQSHSNQNLRVAYNLGLIYAIQGKFQLALEAYEDALHIAPEDVDTLINKGSVCIDLQRYAPALSALDQAIAIKSDIPQAWSNKGIALNHLNRLSESVDAYQEAIRLNPNYHEAWSNLSVPLTALGQYEDALHASDRALAIKPDFAEGYFNKGIALNHLNRLSESVDAYQEAIRLNPNYHEAWSNLSVPLTALGQYEDALHASDRALAIKPDFAEGWSNKAITLNELKRFDEAIAHYDKAIKLKQDMNWGIGNALHARMRVCDWSSLHDDLHLVTKKISSGEKAINPFALLALLDEPSMQQRAAQIYTQAECPANLILGPIASRDYIPVAPKKKKIRIGYFSADFKNHAVSILIPELLELHDRESFEVFAFSFGVDDQSFLRSRIVQGVDHFIDVSDKSSVEIAKLSRELRVDIAIDLGGFTADSRTTIFAYRAAPIQVSYLGYLGTMGADYIDYLIADRTMISEGLEHYYSEKIIYLPSFQVNDRQRKISNRKFTRQELGLPDQGFVYCCLNSTYKILPLMFDSWMRILKAVEGSVLFLYAENVWAKENLKKSAQARGIDSSRLVFGKSIPADEYLARYKVCDLFLDTFPYNAGTTASDALWTGLPVLTMAGKSFASRMGASLLNAIGLPALITESIPEYEALAIDLARDYDRFVEVKTRLEKNRLTSPLFDTPKFTKSVESAYFKMVERYRTNLPLSHIKI